MPDASVPDNELARIQALEDYDLLDTGDESHFDDVTRVASAICQAPVALIGLMDRERLFLKSSVGVLGDNSHAAPREVPRSISFCNHALSHTGILEIPDLREDARFSTNPQVTGFPYFRFYAGVSLLNRDGFALGSLCVLDHEPRQLNDSQRESLMALGRVIMGQFEQRREAQKSASEVRSLAHVARLTQNPVIITDADDRVQWVNPSFESLTGYSLEEIRGRQPGRLLQGPDTSVEARQRISQHLEAGKPVRQEILNYSRSGRRYWLDLDIQPVRNELGELVNFVAIETDITQRKEQEEQLMIAKETAEASNRAKSRFLANISHELRTPLNGIVGISELLRKNPARADLSAQLTTLNESSQGLLAIINDLLDLSKIDAESLSLESCPFDLHKLLEDLRNLFQPMVDAKGLRLEFEGFEQVPRFVQGDSLRLRQILTNLLGNAVKFTDRGVVALSLEQGVSFGDTCTLVFRVRDSGIGIPETSLEKIFEPFAQADDSLSRRYGGTGLGLAICRRLVAMMGGEILVSSTVNKGSTFSFNARMLVSSKEEVSQSDDLALDESAQERITGRRVLVVDDNLINRQVATAMLEELDATAVACENGEQAVAAFRDECFDLALIDIQMPGMDGFTLARALRDIDQQRQRRTPFIALTAYSSAEYLQHKGTSDIDGHVCKPLSFQNLSQALLDHGSAAGESANDAVAGPLVDTALLMRNMNDDLKMVDTLVQLFLSRHEAYSRDLTEALSEGDLSRFARAAHSLKGTLGYFNQGGLWQEAVDLEKQARAGDLGYLARNLPVLLGQVNVLVEELKAIGRKSSDAHGRAAT